MLLFIEVGVSKCCADLEFSVCRKLSNSWHRNCRAPPPNLYRPFDISTPQHLLSHQNIFKIGENEAIQTLLIKIYSTRFKISFQGSNISFKDIIPDAMLEMLLWKPVTATSCYCIVQKITKSAFEMRSYLLEMSSDPGLQHTETELDEIEIRRIWRQISYFTSVWGNEFFDTSITVYAGVIHDDHTPRSRKETA